MVNTLKLKGRMVEKGMSVEKLSRIMGINRATLYRKLRLPESGITVGDASYIATILELSSQDATDIFFGL